MDCWISTSNWNWLRFNMSNPTTEATSINWNYISFVELEFNKTSTTGVVYLDYMSIANNSLGYNYTGDRNITRTTRYE